MSKSSVALLVILFLALMVGLNAHYYYALDQQYRFTEWVLTSYCPRGPAR